jgi:hypothetical protein
LVAVPTEHRFASRTDITVVELAGEPWIAAGGTAAEPQFGVWPTLSEPRIAT